MATRYLALPALAGALFGASVAAFAQSAEPPAGGNAPPYAAAPAANAANAGAHRKHRHGPMARALKGLALNHDQREKIRGFMQEYRAARAGATPETRAQLRARIESVLTPDERTRFETRLRRGAHGKPPLAAPPGAASPSNPT